MPDTAFVYRQFKLKLEDLFLSNNWLNRMISLTQWTAIDL
jgi:hypothetical protein